MEVKKYLSGTFFSMLITGDIRENKTVVKTIHKWIVSKVQICERDVQNFTTQFQQQRHWIKYGIPNETHFHRKLGLCEQNIFRVGN